MILPWLWAVFTVTASLAQTARNASQRHLTGILGTVGATHVRFLFGLPFALIFLALVLTATGRALPSPNLATLLWTASGGVSQIFATALMLAAMRERSFVVTIAYTKLEPVLVALFGLAFLGDKPTLAMAVAILVATAGVMIMSWPKAGQAGEAGWSWRPAAMGCASAALFGYSAIGFRGGILSLGEPNFVVAATTTLCLGLTIQTALLTTWLAATDRKVLAAIFRAWKPSLFAGFMGAFASQFWFLGFAVTEAARVRTLALVEVIFAQVVTRKIFRQGVSLREGLGMGLIVVGVVLLLNA